MPPTLVPVSMSRKASTLSYERCSFSIVLTRRSRVHTRPSFSLWYLSMSPVRDDAFTLYWYVSGVMPPS